MDPDGAIEIAFVARPRRARGSRGSTAWVLMRVAGDPDGRILVYDRHEWECFLDGARAGEFDDGAQLTAVRSGRGRAGLGCARNAAFPCPARRNLGVS